MDIQILIAESKNGTTEAFSELVERFREPMFRLAFRLLCNDDDARDAVQDTFVKAWLSINKYDPQYRFETWLHRIAVNVCYDRMRAVKRRKAVTFTLDYADRTADTEAKVINREIRESIMALTGDLPAKQRLVFTLADIEEFSTAEIGELTGLSPSSIKSNLYLARQNIRKNLKF